MGATRRDFLRRAGTAGLAGAAAQIPALGGTASAGTPRIRRELRRLERRLKGPVITPGDPGYETARQIWNPFAERTRPRAIAFCESVGDVAKVVEFAAESDWPISARSGRHSFAGYCNAPGIVADVSRMDGIRYDPQTLTARIGPGANNVDAYVSLLQRNGVAELGGTCPTVGIAGYTLGGGQSRLMRRHGMASDHLLEVDVVLADGRVVRANARRNADLFWACRGGGGGNFGIATSFRVRVFRAPASVLSFSLAWPFERFSEVADAWQRFGPPAPDEICVTSFKAINRPPPAGGGPSRLGVTVTGFSLGSEDDLRDLLGPLLELNPTTEAIRAEPPVQAWLPFGCRANGSQPPVCTVDDSPNYQRSNYVSRLLPARAIDALRESIQDYPGAGAGALGGAVTFEAYGGAINRVPARATAFVHRSMRFNMLTEAAWTPSDPPAVVRANVNWALAQTEAVADDLSGFSYQNYIDPRLEKWEHAYYGVNLPRLRQIKRRYDPGNLFRFAQGIRPAAGRPFTG